ARSRARFRRGSTRLQLATVAESREKRRVARQGCQPGSAAAGSGVSVVPSVRRTRGSARPVAAHRRRAGSETQPLADQSRDVRAHARKNRGARPMIDLSYQNRFGGLERLWGTGALERLKAAHVMVVGLGGVGSW